MRVVFIGGLTNGKVVYDYLTANKHVDLVLAITNKEDCEKPRHVNFPENRNVIKSGTAIPYVSQILELKPDLIVVAGWSELLPDDILRLPIHGTIGFHPSKLPLDRGRSVLAWQIEDGYRETALTMFYYNTIPDGGDIIAQELVKIESNDYISDVLDKVDAATENILRAYFPLIRNGVAPRRPQNFSEGNFRRLRNYKDSMIDWNANAARIIDKIRAISRPYPGAEAFIDGKKYRVFRAEVMRRFPFAELEIAGSLMAVLYDGSMVVKCRKEYVRVTNYECIS